MKRLHSDPPEQHNEWGATSASKAGEARGLLASFLWLSQKSSPEPGGNASLSLSHTNSSVTTEGQQCSQASQSGRVGNEAVSSSVCDRGWMDGSYVCTRCVSGEPDGCSCV